MENCANPNHEWMTFVLRLLQQRHPEMYEHLMDEAYVAFLQQNTPREEQQDDDGWTVVNNKKKTP